MKVRYRANAEVREISDEAARELVAAGICDLVEEVPPTRTKKAR